MSEYLTTTRSTCAECGRLLPARVSLESDGVWFHKECPEHGPQEARVAGDARGYLKLGRYFRRAVQPLRFTTPSQGCPESCGLCPEHEQHVCMPILEITDHCDLRCPICLVRNRGTFHRTPAEVGAMLDTLIAAEGQIDVLNLSGGEPTLNPHFRAIIETCLARPEILRVSVSTNGLALSRDPELLEFLAARQVIISLQYDGSGEAIATALRGRCLQTDKQRLIELCRRLDTSMSLTATVVAGVNEAAVAEVVSLLFQTPHIVSVMLQPAAYTGQASKQPRPAHAVTLSDVLARLEGVGDGRVSARDFSPLPCGHPACFSLAFYLRVEGERFLPIKRLLDPLKYLDLIQNRGLFGTDADGFNRVKDAIYDIWSSPSGFTRESQEAMGAVKRLIAAAAGDRGFEPAQALRAAERDIKSIFIHQFMDRHTFDLSRARKCCQVYPQPDGRLLPVCIRNCLQPGNP